MQKRTVRTEVIKTNLGGEKKRRREESESGSRDMADKRDARVANEQGSRS
jgi:hypothetical protein